MRKEPLQRVLLAVMAALAWGSIPSAAEINVQCPGDRNNDGVSDTPGIVCKHVSSGDGFIQMADIDPETGKRREMYIFGFSDLTGVRTRDVMRAGELAANFPAPLIDLDEGDQVYLNLSNVGMIMRPDLFDPHTVHFHGFPQAAADLRRRAGSAHRHQHGRPRFTYYYKLVEPGHLHVPLPRGGDRAHADGHAGQPLCAPSAEQAAGTARNLNGFTHQHRLQVCLQRRRRLDRLRRGIPAPASALRPQLPRATWPCSRCLSRCMKDNYRMINGRGYPDTVEPGAAAGAAPRTAARCPRRSAR